MSQREPQITIRRLRKIFRVRGEDRRPHDFVAVDDIDFDIMRGETFGLIGESGSGKTTTGRMILQLEQATSGSVMFEGNDLTALGELDLRRSVVASRSSSRTPALHSTPGAASDPRSPIPYTDSTVSMPRRP